MAETPPDKAGFLSRLLGRKVDTQSPGTPIDERGDALPSPAVTGIDDLAAAPPTVASASPDTPAERKLPPELAGADLQPVESFDHAPQKIEQGWWQRLTHGMRRTTSALSQSVTELFTKRRLDAAALEELEDTLIKADLGLETAARIA